MQKRDFGDEVAHTAGTGQCCEALFVAEFVRILIEPIFSFKKCVTALRDGEGSPKSPKKSRSNGHLPTMDKPDSTILGDLTPKSVTDSKS